MPNSSGCTEYDKKYDCSQWNQHTLIFKINKYKR